MKIILLDQTEEMTMAWKKYFSDQSDVEIVKDDFVWFMNDHPEIDCIVSPANSYGLMDGGYDAAITRWFGRGLMAKVQDYIIENYYGEQPVASSFIIDTNKPGIKLIHTPTMRIPSTILDPMVVYHSTRSTLIEAMKADVKYVVIPAFGGAAGELDYNMIAYMMWNAYLQLKEKPEKLDWAYAYRWEYEHKR